MEEVPKNIASNINNQNITSYINIAKKQTFKIEDFERVGNTKGISEQLRNL